MCRFRLTLRAVAPGTEPCSVMLVCIMLLLLWPLFSASDAVSGKEVTVPWAAWCFEAIFHRGARAQAIVSLSPDVSRWWEAGTVLVARQQHGRPQQQAGPWPSAFGACFSAHHCPELREVLCGPGCSALCSSVCFLVFQTNIVWL